MGPASNVLVLKGFWMFILFVQFQYLSTSWWQSVAETTIGLEFRFLPVMAVWLRFMTWYIIFHNFVQGPVKQKAIDPLTRPPKLPYSRIPDDKRREYLDRLWMVMYLLSLWSVVFVPAVGYDVNMKRNTKQPLNKLWMANITS